MTAAPGSLKRPAATLAAMAALRAEAVSADWNLGRPVERRRSRPVELAA